ncbi:lipopolysaccharide core heptose(I) kinase RfaP [Thauera sp. CAU 1555]|uniref:Lipopolysaccharide core heptose(I) kinase n=1 Tax=Thauera sedimentorum TaxID=2767595 RepID=A0ABR9BA43_9RHOO|nr:lipopolysaccharide core heptose(I) kinase RfaP [Thauera sedimentorum]MBC9072302.1 lipopolysaccharide core heptose(I) kinase RfaP [Thauera sedimentorum]MBD8503221.1 lipopolysaccharide core heptose(I) kinase RfaP [Thauera sedimentorum]
MNQVTLAPPLDRLWAGRDPFAATAELARNAPPDAITRDVEGRRTLRFELDGRGYYLKLQSGIGWGRILGELARLRLPVLGAGNEWRAIGACHRLGVPTMNAVGYGERGRGWTHRTSFLVTEAIEPAVDLDTCTRGWVDAPPPLALKRALLAEVARIARTLHEGGLNHRDFYLCHFLLATEPPPSPAQLRVSLIDLHRVQIRARTPARWRNKDLAALYFSALRIGLTRRDKLRFLRAYFGAPLRTVLVREAGFLKWLEREAQRLLLRFDRKFAHRPALQK